MEKKIQEFIRKPQRGDIVKVYEGNGDKPGQKVMFGIVHRNILVRTEGNTYREKVLLIPTGECNYNEINFFLPSDRVEWKQTEK